REDAFDDNRAFPERTNPLHVVPGECLALHRSVRVTNPQYTRFGTDDIGHVGKAAVKEEAYQPTWTSENLRCERDLRPEIAAQKLLHPVTYLALPVSDDGRIDRNHKDRVSHFHRSTHCILRRSTAAREIQLIPSL